jgi:NAD(P)H-flavin reductase
MTTNQERMKPVQLNCRVESFIEMTPTVFEIKFSTDLPVTFKAGQFISIIIPGAGPQGRDLRRAYSVASAPESHHHELCVKLVEKGPGTNYLYRLKVGDHFKGVAPYGDFLYETSSQRHACFISTGTGIAPFRSMVQSQAFQKNKPQSATLLLGVRTLDEILYDAELGQLSGLSFVKMISQPEKIIESSEYQNQNIFKGRVTDYLRNHSKTPWAETDFYLCGAGPMIDEVKQILASKEVSKEAIFQEVYYKVAVTK